MGASGPTDFCSNSSRLPITSRLAALSAGEERQGEAPVALLGDHPVIHVAQPVQFPLHTEAGDPADLLRDRHDLRPHFIKRDEPLVHQPED